MTPWLVLAGVTVLAVFFVLVPVVLLTWLWFRVPRRLRCPETGTTADVKVDAGRAAFTAAFRHPPDARVLRCSLWPERHTCAERCVNPGETEVAASGARIA
jgi:hypothetical protein